MIRKHFFCYKEKLKHSLNVASKLKIDEHERALDGCEHHSVEVEHPEERVVLNLFDNIEKGRLEHNAHGRTVELG